MVPLLLIALSPSLVWGLSIGQRDTFEDGTTAGWTVALLGMTSPTPPVTVPGGGPGGADDGYLLLGAIGGDGSGSRLVMINIRQWTGDFIAAGITGIRMDLNNLGANDLSLRLLFWDGEVGPPVNLAFSTVPLLLPAGSGWTPALFPISPADLTAEVGSALAALHHTTQLRLYHGTDLAFPGEPVVASLGVDNITATPEPTSVVLLGSGLLALSWRTWRARRPRA
jgi:hypothetical protein